MNVSTDVSHFSGSYVNRFASPEWAGVFDNAIMPLAVGNDSVTKAVLNLFTYKRLGKTVVINSPFSENCGLSFHFGTPKRFGVNSDVKRVMRAIAGHMNEEYANAYIDIALPPEIKDIQPFLQLGFHATIGYTYRLKPDLSEKDLLSEFSPERRKNVRDGQKAGLGIRFDPDPESVLQLLKDTWQQADLKFDSERLRKIMNREWSFTISIWDASRLVAAAVIVFDEKCAYYIAGGTVKGDVNTGAGALALWEAIKKSGEMNLGVFDFCGSSVPAIEKFFRGFGGELIPYFRIRKNNQLFDLIKSTKNKLSIH